jgi:competence protein ComFC
MTNAKSKRSHQQVGALKSWLDVALSFFYPEVCQICHSERALAREGYVCARCCSGPGGLRHIEAPFCERCGLPYEGEISGTFECSHCREMELHFLWARAAVATQGLALEVIVRYKYQRALWFEPFLADLICRAAVPVLCQQRWDFIVPVPLYPLKQREREFNQATRLARRLAKATSLPLHSRLLKRVEPTRTQTRLNFAERAANVRNAFSVGSGIKMNGERIVLVDDVLTTGATASACARALTNAGSGDVCVWTVARGVR